MPTCRRPVKPPTTIISDPLGKSPVYLRVPPLVDGQPKVSIISVMAALSATLVPSLGTRCLIELYGQTKDVAFLCFDMFWKPIGEKVRFVLVADGGGRFILMGSDMTLGAKDMILAYSYRFKIEVSFKVLKHVIGAFFYRFWTHAWPRIGTATGSDLSMVTDSRKQRLIAETTDSIEAFVNFGCIATGILQILALNYHETIWKRYMGWLRTVSSTIPSEEVVQTVVQQEYFHNFGNFSNDAIYRIIKSKNRRHQKDRMPLTA